MIHVLKRNGQGVSRREMVQMNAGADAFPSSGEQIPGIGIDPAQNRDPSPAAPSKSDAAHPYPHVPAL